MPLQATSNRSTLSEGASVDPEPEGGVPGRIEFSNHYGMLSGKSRPFRPHVGVTGIRLVVDRQNGVAVGLRTKATGHQSFGSPGEPSNWSCLHRFTHDLKMHPLPENFVKAGLKLAKNPAGLRRVGRQRPPEDFNNGADKRIFGIPFFLFFPR